RLRSRLRGSSRRDSCGRNPRAPSGRYSARRCGAASAAPGGGRRRRRPRRAVRLADHRWPRSCLAPCHSVSLCHRARAMAKLEPRGRKVKIPARLGAASREPEMMRRLSRAGADAFRVNLSHGDHATHAATIKTVRALEKEFNRPIAVLCDLQGPKLRVGSFVGGQAIIPHGHRFTLDRDPAEGRATRVCLPHPELFEVLEVGPRLLISDGKIRLRVTEAAMDRIVCIAEDDGVITDRKGVNVPDDELPIPALT